MARTVRRFPESGDYLTFMEEFLLKNEPCVFSEMTTRDWRARQQWQKDGKPNMEYLDREFGDARVPVADCSNDYFNSHAKTEMKMTDYLHYWSKRATDGDTDSLLYLKDWHFSKQYPSYTAYTIPPYFTCDWLNETWDHRTDIEDDYRFVYIGPAGTWTPFHADVFRSYSWSANVCGRKEWLLFPPGEEDQLRDKQGRLPSDLRKSPHYCESAIRVVQEMGEVIFIPSGWYHQVHNLADTISINHNWVNGFGVYYMWKHIKSELQLVKREIEDCRDMVGWEKQCQVLLRACVGIDYHELLQMLCLLARSRLAEVDSLSPPYLSPPMSPPFTDLRDLITRVNLCSDFTLFGTEQLHPKESPPRPADRLKEVLDNCSSLTNSSPRGSTVMESLTECLPMDLKIVASGMNDVLTRTLYILRIHELHQIKTILRELLTDTDMVAVTHKDIYLAY